MRYSIIHHDIKDRFELTVCEYLVCDSIHQLSARGTYKGSWLSIEEFLGVSRKTVWNTRVSLKEKGLLEDFEGGTRTTEVWFQAVTEASKGVKNTHQRGKNIPSMGKNYPNYPLYKEDKETITSVAEPPLTIFREENNKDTERPSSNRKYKNAREVFKWFPRPEKSWEINKTELAHAELLFDRTEAEVKKRLAYYERHKDEEFIPRITKPSDLERRWNDLSAYAKRN